MFCSKCGNQIQDGAAFCPSCGNKVGETTSASVEEKVIVKSKKDYIMCVTTRLHQYYNPRYPHSYPSFFAKLLSKIKDFLTYPHQILPKYHFNRKEREV